MDPASLLLGHLLLSAPVASGPMLLREPLMVRPTVAQLASAQPASPNWAAGPAESERLAHRARLVTAHTTLEIATAVSLALTGTLGVLTAVNRPSAFGDGRCASGDPVFGNYGCESLSIVHGISAVGSTGLYIATMVLEAVTPDPPWSQESPGWRSLRRVMTYVHIGGMILQPLLGMLSAYPGIIGINDAQGRYDFSRTLRTVHMGVGVLTAGAFLTTVAIDVF